MGVWGQSLWDFQADPGSGPPTGPLSFPGLRGPHPGHAPVQGEHHLQLAHLLNLHYGCTQLPLASAWQHPWGIGGDGQDVPEARELQGERRARRAGAAQPRSPRAHSTGDPCLGPASAQDWPGCPAASQAVEADAQLVWDLRRHGAGPGAQGQSVRPMRTSGPSPAGPHPTGSLATKPAAGSPASAQPVPMAAPTRTCCLLRSRYSRARLLTPPPLLPWAPPGDPAVPVSELQIMDSS